MQQPINKPLQIGVDEVGRGPLLGRVYAAAVILPDPASKEGQRFEFHRMKDSKKFHSEKKLKETADYIRQNAVQYSIQWRDEKHIDRVNILQATQDAMHEAITDVIAKQSHQPPVERSQPERVERSQPEEVTDLINSLQEGLQISPKDLQNSPNFKIAVDGNYFRPFTDENTGKFVPYECIIQGDATHPTIAAASIIAKVARDQYIADLCNEFPELVEKYDLAKNKGYGTKRHRDGIQQHGITEWHRTSFRNKGT